MTKKETIQVLQSIEDRAVDFPYMTACDWVAIAAAKRHLENALEVKEVDFEEGLKTQNKNIWHPMSETAEHPCAVLMHGYGNDVWIADAVETLEQGAAQEWAYMDDVLTVLGLKAKGE
jgi:hypothetical protein